MKADPSTKQGLNGSGPAEDRLRVLLPVAAFMLMALCWTTSDSAEPLSDDKRYFNIPQQRADLSLTQFAEQAGLTLLFKFNIAKRKTANNLTGHYTVNEAVEVLLADTGLHPVFSDQGQLMSVSDDMPETEGGSMDTKKRAGVVAVLAGVLAGGVQAQEPTVTEAEIQTSVVAGRVTEARTGANLEGARVTIEETGQWTSTNDRGQFQFLSIAPGEYTLRVSFLGYAEQSATILVDGGSLIAESFALRGGSEIEEIVVFGTRSARAQSLNQERTAKNFTTVLASDFLGNFTGDTISEALRLAPGVAFEQDPLTGEGTNIIIRGLEPNLNTVTLNGLRLPEGSGFGRSPDLGSILTESVSKVTISKTLLPSQDSTGTGGIVDIETKSPLDRRSRFFNAGIGGISRSGDFGDGAFASGTVSGKFGSSENLGISLSAQYRESEIRTISYSALSLRNPVLPALNGFPISASNIDPRMPFPFDESLSDLYPERVAVGDSRTDLENVSIGSTIAYEINDHTWLRFDVQYFDEERTTFESEQDTSTFLLSPFEAPIEALGGETRRVLTFEDGGALFGLSDSLLSAGRNATYVPNSKTETTTLSFSGNTVGDKWEFDYEAGYSRSTTDFPQQFSFSTLSNNSLFQGFEQITRSFMTEQALSNTIDDRVVSLFTARSQNGSFPLALLNESGYAYFNDPANYALSFGTLSEGFGGENERWSGKFSAKKNLNHDVFRSITVGAFVEESTFRSGLGFRNSSFSGFQSIDAYGLVFSGSTAAAIGLDPSLSFGGLSEASVLALLRSLESLSSGSAPVISLTELPTDKRNARTLTQEIEYAAFIEAEVQLGKLEIIGGLRVINVDVTAIDTSNSSFTDEFGVPDFQFSDDSAVLFNASVSQTEVLPRILANFRFDENNIARFGYFTTVARPQIGLMSAPRSVSLDLRPWYGPNRDQPRLFVREGNPDLEPAYTHNFDISFEHYNGLGTIQASLFYKQIDNLLQSNDEGELVSIDELSDLPDDSRFAVENLPVNLFVEGERPVNSDDTAEIWGVELAAEYQLTSLPDGWDGLGLFANYTYTDSERDDVLVWESAPTSFDANGQPVAFERRVLEVEVPFAGQPKHSGTAAVTYNRNNIDASLSYSIQSRRLESSLESFGLDEYDDEVDSLDFRAEYRFERPFGTIRVFVEAFDILKDSGEPTLTRSVGGEGSVPQYNIGGRYLGGRSYRFGVTGSF